MHIKDSSCSLAHAEIMGDKSNLQMDRQPIKLAADKNISDITVKLHPTIALYDFALHNFSEEIITWQTNARDINWKIMAIHGKL